MLELNRLKPMPEVYNKDLFNDLYKRTEGLRKKLASQIDSRRFGLSYEDILAAFDVKFIFVFEKFHKESENKLLAMMLNSLQNYKCRILRSAYTKKFSQNIISVDNLIVLEDTLSEDHPSNSQGNNYFLSLLEFMRNTLSQNAYAIFEIKLNPPLYIQDKLNTCPDANIQKIPDHLILEYFDLGYSEKSYKYLDSIKKEIRNAVNSAKQHFNNN